MSADLSRGAKRCLNQLRWHDSRHRLIFVSQERLATNLKVCVRQVQRYIQELRAVGLVQTTRRGDGKTSLYRLVEKPIETVENLLISCAHVGSDVRSDVGSEISEVDSQNTERGQVTRENVASEQLLYKSLIESLLNTSSSHKARGVGDDDFPHSPTNQNQNREQNAGHDVQRDAATRRLVSHETPCIPLAVGVGESVSHSGEGGMFIGSAPPNQVQEVCFQQTRADDRGRTAEERGPRRGQESVLALDRREGSPRLWEVQLEGQDGHRVAGLVEDSQRANPGELVRLPSLRQPGVHESEPPVSRDASRKHAGRRDQGQVLEPAKARNDSSLVPRKPPVRDESTIAHWQAAVNKLAGAKWMGRAP